MTRIVRMMASPPSRVVQTAGSGLPIDAIKGRGAVSSPQGRFESLGRENFDDGWQSTTTPGDLSSDDPFEQTLPSPTLVKTQTARSAISINQSPDIAFDASINPYRGCEHGCVYCYARPGHAYEGLSPGIDFETRIFARDNLAERLAAEIDKPGYQCSPITIGAFTDAYQPIERTRRITRATIQVLLDRQHPFSIITKSALIQRDSDLLADAARHKLVSCIVSITSTQSELSRLWEPRASAPHKRFATIEALSQIGIPTAVNVAPIVPFINDNEIETIIEQAARAGASRANYIVLRLPNEVRPIFVDWLQTHFPDRAERVLNKLREMRGQRSGDTRLNDARFHTRMRGEGPWADLIADRFRLACRRFDLELRRPELRVDLFRSMPDREQFTLF